MRDIFITLKLRLRGLFFRRQQEQALHDELGFHRDQLYQEFRDQGMTESEARRAVDREFGAFADAYVEASRDTWRPPLLSALLHDLRFAFRSMRRTPGFSLLAVLTLAVGIGACTTMFSVIQSTVRQALPVAEQDRLAFFWEDNANLGIQEFSQSVPNFVDYRDRATSFESVIGLRDGSVSLATEHTAATHARSIAISAGFTQTFGWPLRSGRDFLPIEDQPGGEPLVIISERLWRERFGASEDVLGQTLLIDRLPHRIIGVLQGSPDLFGNVDVWRPLRPDPTRVARDDHWLTVVAQLKPGVSLEQANAEIDTLAAALRNEYPDSMQGWDAHLEPLQDQVVPADWVHGLHILFAAVSLLLLIACANVANLLLSRSLVREQEFAIRTSLGATRGQLARQLLAESLVLAVAGTTLGVLLAAWGVEALRALAPADLPRMDQLALTLPSFGFAAIACVLATVLAGLLPALKGSAAALAPGLGAATKTIGGSRNRSRLRDALVVVQVALSLALLIGGGLLWRSFERLRSTNPGFNADHVLTFQYAPDASGYAQGADIVQLYQRLHDKLAALPGVTSVGLTSSLPFGDGSTSLNVFPAGPAAVPLDESIQASWRIVDGDYFTTLQIPLVEGRLFSAADDNWEAPVIILSRRLAERFWPGESALGRQVDPGGGGDTYTVIGVVEDIRLQDLSGRTENPQMYFPHTLWAGWRHQAIALRTNVAPESLAETVRATVQSIDSQLPIYGLTPLADLAARDLRLPRLSTWLLGIFAGVALLLATVGLFAVMSTTIAQRTREIGVRLALGAPRSTVLGLVLGHGARLVGTGVLVGVGLAAAASQALASLLYQTPSLDLGVFAAAALVLILTAMLALAQPARRALRIDPITALRAE